MALLTWSAQFSVNIAELDAQHQHWCGLINELHEAMRAGTGKEKVGATLQAVIAYANTHFAREEQLMKAHNYPGYLHHKGIHDRFLAEIKELQAKLENGSLTISMELMSKMKAWLISHIQHDDQKYGPFLNRHGVQ